MSKSRRTFTLLGLCIGALALLAGCAAGGNQPEKNLSTTFDPQTGQFAPCPPKPNCVSSQATGTQHGAEPLPFAGDLANSKARVLAIVNAMPRSQVETDEPNYLHVTFRSRIFRFVDDVEFYFDEENEIIQFRAAARTGYSDFDVNRKRMDAIRQALAE